MKAHISTLLAIAALGASLEAAAKAEADAAAEREVPEPVSAAPAPARPSPTLIVTAKRLEVELKAETPVAPAFDAVLALAMEFDPPRLH